MSLKCLNFDDMDAFLLFCISAWSAFVDGSGNLCVPSMSALIIFLSTPVVSSLAQ